ncbi:MAG TPA: patatin-like phospholipase family protein [Vicinamibacterales bacterium]|nr:patatin-like phospholipase family protein [Vicinamibacterales bacterium]
MAKSLILAGGGLKVGFQAGVLQVWLDEAGITFDHADGASGGCLNLAMYCQGYTGKQIADAWRNYDPFLPMDVNLDGPNQFTHMQSFFTYDRFRANVLPRWGIDWNLIRAGNRVGTFNLCNFSKKRLEVVTNAGMDEDRLVSAVSLPMWFPPVVIDGDKYIDAVYITDANVEEAIRRGADEIWAIWTVSTRDEWRPGFVSQYFHIIETVADTNFFTIWGRLEKNNQEIAAGRPGEFGRKITLRLIQAEVPVHYLFNFERDRMTEAVNQGVAAAREFCRQNNIPLQAAPAMPVAPTPANTSLQFTETMRGFISPAADFQPGFDAGKQQNTKLDVRLTIRTDDVDAFIVDPAHKASVTGTADSPLLGGKVQVVGGEFNLLVSAADPRKKEMRYRLLVNDAGGAPHTIVGFKKVEDNGTPAEVFGDTTTLFTTLYKGHHPGATETPADRKAIGIITIHFLDFLAQLTTFRTEGPTLAARTAALARFTGLFMGKLTDVYGGFLTV